MVEVFTDIEDNYEPLPVRRGPTISHEGKGIIVTGAAGGLGAAIVARLTSEGAKVAAWDVRSDALETAGKYWRTEAVMAVQCDLADKTAIHSAFHKSLTFLGAIDGVVNCAAVSKRAPSPLDFEWSDFEVVSAVNLFAPYEIARLACKNMIENRRPGSIVNVSSEAGKKGHTMSVPYSASKAGLINLTRVLAEAVAKHDINVNCVCPGAMATDMLRRVAEHYAKRMNAQADDIYSKLISPQLKRQVEPDEVTSVISFLLSDGAMSIRGQSINTDGGGTPY